jgi:hypothetical protein
MPCQVILPFVYFIALWEFAELRVECTNIKLCFILFYYIRIFVLVVQGTNPQDIPYDVLFRLYINFISLLGVEFWFFCLILFIKGCPTVLIVGTSMYYGLVALLNAAIIIWQTRKSQIPQPPPSPSIVYEVQ